MSSIIKDVETYQDLDQLKALADEKVDAVISAKDGEYQVDYANTDASKNTMTRQVWTSIASEGTDQLVSRVKQALPQLTFRTQKTPWNQGVFTSGDENAASLPAWPGFDRFCSFLLVFLIPGMAFFKERTSEHWTLVSNTSETIWNRLAAICCLTEILWFSNGSCRFSSNLARCRSCGEVF